MSVTASSLVNSRLGQRRLSVGFLPRPAGDSRLSEGYV
jgi:hypothetical protein